MSEKTAKKDRKEPPKITHEMRIQVLEKDGKFKVNVVGIPNKLDHALSMLADATRVVVSVYMQAAASGEVGKVEPSRIIPASSMPPRLH